jgi:hypothetical protein
VLALRGACRIEEALLAQQYVGAIGVLARVGGLLRGDDVRERTGNVHGSSAPAFLRLPWHRAIKGEVQLEHAGSVAEAAQETAIPTGQFLARDGQHLTRGEVEHQGPARREIRHLRDGVIHVHLDAEIACGVDQSVGELLHPAAYHRPSVGVADRGEHQPEGRGRPRGQPHHRVGRHPSEQGAGALTAETGAEQSIGGPQSRASEPGERQRMARQARGPEERIAQYRGIHHERSHQGAVSRLVDAHTTGRLLHRPVCHDRGAVIQWVGERIARMDQLHPTLREIHALEERGRLGQGRDRGAHIVHETR